MADPAWGAMSLSDEEMARALCAFQHKEPLPTQRRRPLQLRPRQPEMPQLAAGARAASGLSAFGYPSNGATYHTAPMSARQDEAASLLMGMHSPSTSSDDWQQQQKRAIQEQIEQQQRELQAQMQAQQQRDMQAQLQQIQAQIQRQEQLHRQQEQVQQHVQRHVERIQQSPYASGIDQTRWGGHMSLSDGGSQRTAVQRPTQFYDGGFQRSQLLPVRPTTTTTTTSAYAVDYAEDSQAGVSMSRNEGRFAAQQGPPPAQSHFRARNPEHFAASALHPWEMSEPLSFSGIQVDRTKMQTMQQFMPQQHQQPQPYHSAEVHQRSDHEASMLMRASRVVPDVTFLNGVMRHFPTSGGSNVGALTTTATSNAVSGMSRDHKLMFTPAPAQLHPRAQYPVEVRAQMDAQSRMPLPPTGTTIVPGVSLASQPTRLISMRDLLNVEEMASKVASSRGRPRGSKQQLAPPKRKPQKKPPGKRQRMPQQRNEQRPQQPLISRPNGLLSNQSSSLGPTGASTLITKPCTPMYLAFMESRAARALQQTSGITSTNPSVPVVPTTQPQLSAPSSVKSPTQAIKQVVGVATDGSAPAKRKRASYKRKRVDTPPGVRDLPVITQPEQQQPLFINGPEQTATKPEASVRTQEPDFSLVSTVERALTNKQHTVADDHPPRSAGISNNPVDCAFEQQQLQQQPGRPSVFNSVQSQNKLEGGSSTQRIHRPNLPQAVSNQLAKHGGGQQGADNERSLSAPWGIPTVSGSNPAFAATSPSVAQALPGSNLPRVENRTVVIFCKRDFMRYQAAKIWRKYQDQLKKQEDWREVRVAGKRTRYLNSRYADELRRQHNKTYKRTARPRKKTAQGVQVACSHEATSLAAHADPVELRKALAKLVNNDAGKSSPPGTPELTADADSGSLASATEIVSNGKHDNSSLVVMRQNAPVKQQEQNCLHISSDGRETKSAASNSHNTVVVPTDLQARADVTNPTSDGNFKTAAAPKANVVANATSNANIELTTEASEGNLPVHNAVSDRHLAASHESPSGNISTSFIGESSSGSIAVSDAVPDNIVIVRAANEARIDSIDSAITRANDNMNSTSPESNIKLGIAVVATGSNGETVVTACVAESNTDEPVIPSQATKEQAINDPDDVFGDNPSQPSAENAEPHPLLGEMSAKSKDHCTNLAAPMME
ncbi:hypothetical protein PRIC1_003450 [Phytophthora ramorum]